MIHWAFVKKTKIIASVGPATWTEEKILALYKSGVNIIRINFSHADYENASRIVEIVQRLNTSGKTKLALLWDLKGPELRLGDYDGVKSYQKWDIFKIFIEKSALLGEIDQYCDYPYLVEDLNIGDIIRIESGIFDVVVKEKKSDHLIVEALNDITIKQRRHVNLPGIQIRLPGLIPQDIENIKFCIEQWFNYIAMSFVRNAAHVEELRALLNQYGVDQDIGIISKIENQEGLDNLEDIIQVSDGIMVARWDLGIEVEISMIPIWQKKIVDLCKSSGKLVIIATQLIESMMEIPFPTRAEVSDIFTAVVQKADAVMTSGETALGKYPIEAIQMMNKVILQAENNIQYHYKEYTNTSLTTKDLEKKSLIKSALEMANDLHINSIVLFTQSGRLARIASSYRPKPNIFAFTDNWNTFTKSALYFGVKSRFAEYDYYKDGLEQALKSLLKTGDIQLQDNIIVLSDIKQGSSYCPSLEIVHVQSFFDSSTL